MALRRSASISSILRSIRELSADVHAVGAPVPAQALLLQLWASDNSRSSPGPIVVLCPTDDHCAELISDIESLHSILCPDAPPLRLCQFPTWDQSPYSPITPSLKTRITRIAALHGMLQADISRPQIFVATLASASQATLPRETLRRHTLVAKTGDPIIEESASDARTQVMQRLLEAGYLRVDPVEDPGTFAVRGDIVDVFPPDRDLPLRIELFDDVIERIREFDPATQRASVEPSGQFEQARIPPAREVLIHRETSARVRERVKSRADDAGISRAARDPILASIHDGIYPDHSDAWAPFAYEEPETFWDYCEPHWPIVWSDELGSLQEWDRYLDSQKKHSEDAVSSGLVLPLVPDLFRWSPSLEKRVRAGSRLFLDQLELAKLDTVGQEPEAPEPAGAETSQEEAVSDRHVVSVRTNQDLSGQRHSLGELEPKFRLWQKQGFQIVALASTQSQAERIRFLLDERSLVCRIGGSPDRHVITIGIGALTRGFRWPAEGLVVLNEDEILGSKHARKQRQRKKGEEPSAAKAWSGLQALSDLSVGDHVVHVDHGIGRYLGLVRLSLSGAPSDFLQLEYANRDKLYLPIYRLNVIQKHSGPGEHVPLDKLGGQQFAKEKERVKEAVRKLAIDLVQLYAERKVRPGIRFSPPDATFQEFEAQFPFDETRDQLKAIDDTLSDLESGRVMDRLVCGDVGYGKTEVAIRAACLAVNNGKQVAVLVPTTVLAHQHEQSFRARMKDLPVSIDSVSRFKSSKEQKASLDGLAAGKVDIIVGTHRLLSKDVKFRDLGLVIVDEEHRFGVEHKERLKTIKLNTHVLTLTATPIPRTLHMSLSGLRDISLMNTPPVDRLPIRTYVAKYDEALIRKAIEVELARGGQVFFVHNRVQSIHEMAKRIHELVPDARIGIGHGQMVEKELEEAMIAFYQKRTNVLVCTTIVESGLDVPNANTLIVNRADAFGLAQLYQIRGRVGRGQQRAYAYLLVPTTGGISEDAKKRLEVIQRFVELGSGFSIASHDLEIRGGGDLLGAQQSGHIAAVGFDLYTELLEEAIRELQGKKRTPEESVREPEIKAPFPAFLDEKYVPNVHQRLSLYRRFSGAATDADLDALEEELRDRFGALPLEAQNLIWLIRIKQLLKKWGIEGLTVGPEKASLAPGPQSRLDPVRAIALISGHPGKYQLTPDSRFVAKIPTQSLRDLYFGLETLFQDLKPRGTVNP